MRTSVILFMVMAGSGGVLGQGTTTPAPPKAPVKTKRLEKVTVFDFEGDDIRGQAKSPEGFYIIDREKLDFKSQILIRKNFTQEIINSLGDL